MRAFCMDVHISIIADFKRIFPEIEIIDWCLSGHAWVFNRQQDVPKHVNAQTWRQFDSKMVDEFRREYDSFLRSFDFFIVGYASCFAMIYEPYNKPIVMLNNVRCDIPFCWSNDLNMLNMFKESIQRINKKGLLTIVSNSKADQIYTSLSLGIRSVIIPSLCLYANIRYNPIRTTFLCYNNSVPNHPLVTQRSELGKFDWSMLGEFKGVIHFPYEPNTMSIFEQFTGGLPLFFPSKSFWKSNPNIQSISAYWGNRLPRELKNMETIDAWIETSDVYTTFASPNTYYFDSIPHLFTLLESFVYVDDRQSRQTYITNVQEKWRTTLGKIVS